MDVVVPKPLLLRLMNAYVIEVIWEPETRSLTVGIVLGIVIILAIGYFRSPWRKLPPSPRRLPVHIYYRPGWVLMFVCGNHRRGHVPERCWTAHSCVQQS